MWTWLVLWGVVIVPLAIMIPMGLANRWLLRRDRRRSPLTGHLLQLPGQGCRRRIESLDETQMEKIASAFAVPPLILAAVLMMRLDVSQLRLGFGDWFLIVLGLSVIVWQTIGVIRMARERRDLARGGDAEVATAQQLSLLMKKGCDVFHGLPADKFDIDHVVVGADAVYAIETKSRRKPAEKGKANAKVDYDGKQLRFPGWAETQPLDQAAFQARWLADYLYRKTGNRVPVHAVLALPGWFVTTSAPKPSIHVINPAMSSFMAGKGSDAFPPDMRRRILTAVEERYTSPVTN